MRIKTIVIATLMAISTGSCEPAHAATSAQACNKYSGRNYVICRESGPRHMPYGLRPGRPHPGKSSATGPCGFLKATRRHYGGDTLDHCDRYARDRYGSYTRAEAFYRRNGWW